MLKLENVNKKFGTFELKNITLEVKDGEYFVILGPTGTGKTIILETIAGMYSPDSGYLYINNIIANNIPPEDRNIGFVYQDYMLFPHLSVKENILFGLNSKKFSKSYKDRFLNEICDILNIKYLLERSISTLSGGEQQRIAFARAIAINPKILLLDEPMSALDPNTKESFMRELKSIHKTLKTTTIHITHDFNEAMYLADRIGIMFEGQLLQVGTPEEIFYNPKSLLVAKFIGAENIFSCYIQNNIAYLENDIQIKIIHKEDGYNTHICLPSDKVKISNKKIYGKENTFMGYVKEIIPKNHCNKLIVDIGINISIICMRHTTENLSLTINSKVWIQFDKENLNIFL
ncbi:molybdate ABC transporter ATP-binding protein ModC [Gottschalkia purinilytica]|uniref:ABC-type quaternary amine transporter n=1 Tax=Gottschalkia purinilytica TaxID=1503 RepID=A0A0L0W8P8_GOTPU|nr:ATP-binding cassette domain-containing protein [Gottschalkia purinilytica]KNF07919.1 molybdate ABC transporter ATP-binding protein ModC [Gottschalkia purinilytica]